MTKKEKKSENSEVFGKIPEENDVSSDEKIENDDEIEEDDESSEENEEEDDDESEEETEEVVESSSKTANLQDKSSDKTDSKKTGAKEKSFFVIKMIISAALLICALIMIRPPFGVKKDDTVVFDYVKFGDNQVSEIVKENLLFKIGETEDSLGVEQQLLGMKKGETKEFESDSKIVKILVKDIKFRLTLYIIYYILFFLFSLGTIFFCCVAEKNVFKLEKFFVKFKSSRGQKSDLKSKDRNINKICVAYKESFLMNENYEKTRSNADLYFGGETYFNDVNSFPVQSFLKIIPGTFIGFGILGTFIGFADGLSGINITNSESLLSGVQHLLLGLKSAFNTSIVGVLASMFLNFIIIHPLFNKLDKKSKELCDYLDTKFFVSEIDAMTVTDSSGTQIPFPQVMEIVLEKLEQVASNINQMGKTVGEQVSQSVKRTLDKTIEKIIKGEIEKLKTEMNSSINILEKIGTALQTAPSNLKISAERIAEAAQKNNELFQKQNDETIGALKETSEEMKNVKDALVPLTEDFWKISSFVQTFCDKLSESQKTLEKSFAESYSAFEKTTEITTALESRISDFSTVLESYNETNKQSQELLSGFKGMDEQIAKIFGQINENTKNYGEIVGKSLSDYLDDFSKATKDVSAKFADATDSLREEVEKLSKIELEKDGK